MAFWSVELVLAFRSVELVLGVASKRQFESGLKLCTAWGASGVARMELWLKVMESSSLVSDPLGTEHARLALIPVRSR